MIEVIVETLRVFLKRFDIVVDVFFALDAVQPALVKRFLEAVAKGICLALDSIQQPRNFAISEAIWLAVTCAFPLETRISNVAKLKASRVSLARMATILALAAEDGAVARP